MTTPLLSRHGPCLRPSLPVLEGMALTTGRLHELCGPARQMLALLVAGATRGPVFWIAPSWQAETLNPDGMVGLAAPERVTFLAPRRAEDILWALEEVLRSGAVPLAVAELPGLPGLTPVRRLHLAAEQGAAAHGTAPLGLILTPDAGGAPGVESRWHLAPAHTAGACRWTLSRRRARALPPQSWTLTRARGRLHLTPATATAAAGTAG